MRIVKATGGGQQRLFTFPNPVHELAARSVAGGVLVVAALILGLSVIGGPGWLWLTIGLAYGFLVDGTYRLWRLCLTERAEFTCVHRTPLVRA